MATASAVLLASPLHSGPAGAQEKNSQTVTRAGSQAAHGASHHAAMTHLAVKGSVDGKNVEWMEKVTDEQYGQPTKEVK